MAMSTERVSVKLRRNPQGEPVFFIVRLSGPSKQAAHILDSIEGARHSKQHDAWTVPAIQRSSLEASIAAIDAAVVGAEGARAANARKREEQAIARAEEQAAAMKAILLDQPELRRGAMVTVDGHRCIVVGLGKRIRVTEDVASNVAGMRRYQGKTVREASVRLATIEESGVAQQAARLPRDAAAALKASLQPTSSIAADARVVWRGAVTTWFVSGDAAWCRIAEYDEMPRLYSADPALIAAARDAGCNPDTVAS